MGVKAVAPTKEHEHQLRNPEKDIISFEYDEERHELICSEGNVLTQSERYLDSKKGTLLYKFKNEVGCKDCNRLGECTTSKYDYRTVKIDSRHSSQKRVLARYRWRY